MKLLWFVTLILGLGVCLVCAQEAGTRLENERGTIVKVGNFGYGIVPDSNKGTRYAPTNMDETYHVDGLRVRFSGVVGELPSSGGRGRVWGTPFELSSIERLQED